MLSSRSFGGLVLVWGLVASGFAVEAAAKPPNPVADDVQRDGKERTEAGGQDARVPKSEFERAGPYQVLALRAEWTDEKRDRPVPVKVYYPVDAEDLCPIVVFSHGLGGSREGYAYLGRHWASHGYVCVHLQHEGSDDEVWRGQDDAREEMQRAAKDPRNSINRPIDVSFAIDQLTHLQGQEGPLQGRLDLKRIAVAGHSFGAFTALAVVGEAGTHASGERSLADPRVKAAIPMSAPVPTRQKQYDAIYGRIAVPCMHLTGTLDESPIAFTKAEDRRIPYDHIEKADQYLVTFVGGDHTIFSGRQRRGRQAERDALFQDLIRACTTAFLAAYLKEDAEAEEWLRAGGLAETLGKYAQLEHKHPSTQPGESTENTPRSNRTAGESTRRRPGISRRR